MTIVAQTTLYGLVADLILLVHFAWVSFVVLGLVFIWVGYFLGLQAVHNFYFRMAHLLAMAIVVLEALFGILCPLTTWEGELRRLAGDTGTYEETFMQHWVHRILFFDLAPGAFTIIYCVFFLAMVLSLLVVRPRLPVWLRRGRRTVR